MQIERIYARQIFDSRGHPTIETTVMLDTGDLGVASVPSGASTGSHEAIEIRDKGTAYGGLGVTKAIANIHGPIFKALKGMDIRDQAAIDQSMIDADGTINKSALGGNAILSVSLAAARAHAALTKTPLYDLIRKLGQFDVSKEHRPRVMMNIMNGGKHADNKLKIQEFIIIPSGKTADQMIERGVTVYMALAIILRQKGLSTMLGDEGGFAPQLESETQVLDLILEAVELAGYIPGDEIEIGLDLAATTFYDPGKDRYMLGDRHGLAAVGMIGLIGEWKAKYPIATIEDPLYEDDWKNWTTLTKKFKEQLVIIGDDLFVTSAERLDRGIAQKAANGILIKPNQVGTLTETIQTIESAKQAGFTIAASHRSGETNDAFITDLAIGVGADFLKAGAPARGERVAKYNRYLAIEREVSA